MLLNPDDYSYQYFKQPRGDDGDSGRIHLAMPKKPGLCQILVKDYKASDAINEFVACNIGQRIGINTPKAWLFKAKKTNRTINTDPINFARAVGIEYLEGFDERKGGSFATEDLTVQTIWAELLHILMRETDQRSIAQCNGKIYAFDFADGMYWQINNEKVLGLFKEWIVGNGFTKYQRLILDQEVLARREMRQYFHNLIQKGIPGELVYKTYSELRDNIMSVAEKDGFADLVQEIQDVFSESIACFVKELIGAVCNTMIDFLLPEGEYYRTSDGVLVMTSEKPKPF